MGVDNARLQSGHGIERATPHKLSLCVLIKLYGKLGRAAVMDARSIAKPVFVFF